MEWAVMKASNKKTSEGKARAKLLVKGNGNKKKAPSHVKRDFSSHP